MFGGIVGQRVDSLPYLPILVDSIVTPSDEYFQPLLDYCMAPETISSSTGYEVYCFDFVKSASKEGECSEFFLVVKDGVIVEMRRGETLNL